MKELLQKDPTKPLELAVFGMLPKNKHRSNMLGRLKLVTGAAHTFEAQKPIAIQL
jgi:large subunit ribosomal protein L13